MVRNKLLASGHGDEKPLVILSEHLVISSLAFLSLQQHVHHDLAVFLPGFIILNIPTPVKISNHNNSFLIVIIIK